MQDFINELKNISLENQYGFSSDYLISNTFRIGQVFHKYNMSKYLKTTKTLSNFILKHIKKEENIKLWFYADYYLKQYKWLPHVLKTVYKRPDISFLYRPLYYPEMITAKQFQKTIGNFKLFVKKHNESPIKPENNILCLFDCHINFYDELIQDIKQENPQKYVSFYLQLNEDFKQKLLNNDFDVINSYSPMHNSIELIDHKNGKILGIYRAEIGERYLFYMPKEEIIKLYQTAVNNYKKEE